MLIVVMLEGAIVGTMKLDNDGHDFTSSQCASSQTFSVAVIEQMTIEHRLKVLAEVINLAEDWYNSMFKFLEFDIFVGRMVRYSEGCSHRENSSDAFAGFPLSRGKFVFQRGQLSK